MNTSNIKSYAPKARKDFIAAITKQAAKYGITANEIMPVDIKGDMALIGDRAFPASIAKARLALEERIKQTSFTQLIELVAYHWFNRLCAIRYMELHDYLGHGRRVLSHPTEPTGYQILDDCLDIELPGLNKQKITTLKLDGTKDEELYRELLLAQCHALHKAMPFLFEALDDETELLLPENLTKTDSLIHDLVTDIPEADWDNIEIIGWLYQFYISEKKDQVIGKVVKSEDIPAATQLFTPNWIVKYMVQNSLGAQWLATYLDSPLKAQMEYYIEPAEQTDEVNAQLKEITPTSLNPEELTLIDPASGSGHILVEAYDLFKAIYLERGYRQRDVPQLILEKNLFGLDIDERAAQLTGFALMMKGRADDHRLFTRGVKLNVMALQDSSSFDAESLAQNINLAEYGLNLSDLTELKDLFEHATTFGSLIQVPEALGEKLPRLKQLSETTTQDMFVKDSLNRLGPLVVEAKILAARYNAVVANPPYMGGKGMNTQVKKFTAEYFPDAKSDLFACFMERALTLANDFAFVGIVAPYVWMFLPSYYDLRKKVLGESNLSSLIQLEYNAFEPACIPVATFTLSRHNIPRYSGTFIRLSDFKGYQNQSPKTLEAISNPSCEWHYLSMTADFKNIPGWPIAYWINPKIADIFQLKKPLSEKADPKNGLQTSDNDRFLRLWYEVEFDSIGFGLSSREQAKSSENTWFPTNKGGTFRKWYGNHEFVVNWFNDGEELFNFRPKSVIRNPDYYFQDSVSWSDVTSSMNAFRYYPEGFIHNITAPSAFGGNVEWKYALTAFCNVKFVTELANILNPSMHFTTGDFGNLPNAIVGQGESQSIIGATCIQFAKTDWDVYERSWDFQRLPFLAASSDSVPTLKSSYTAWITQNRDTIAEMKLLEEENNRLFIDAYGLSDELTPDVPIEQITLTGNPAYRYGIKGSEEERWIRFREDTMQELVSYAIGCMMGRYSLGEPGLIYAHSGNQGFDASRYNTFAADDDGIVPLTDKEWFSDDAANRLVEFIDVAWPVEHVEENLHFLAANLAPKKGEGSRDTLRRYLSDAFFKKHMQTYKKRPIYWLFSSGKQKAFQCLVYLHRYNESTLARMRTEYVIPLTAKMSAYEQKLKNDADASGSAAEIKRLEKEIAQLHKQQAELSEFDEKLRHYADQRITIDLDDGVKVNYGKFGDLLAEVKAVTGNKP